MLTELNLSWNAMGMVEMTDITKFLAANRSLRNVNISWNNLTKTDKHSAGNDFWKNELNEMIDGCDDPEVRQTFENVLNREKQTDENGEYKYKGLNSIHKPKEGESPNKNQLPFDYTTVTKENFQELLDTYYLAKLEESD
jgi:predicted MPP superfamily phosphohydrolase